MKIKEQTKKLALGCSKHILRLADTGCSKHNFEVGDKAERGRDFFEEY
ncbi:chlorohydrolase [Streptococcus pneumoniae]|nr:chlorohydrolase [Streptococcus pneumoniae]